MPFCHLFPFFQTPSKFKFGTRSQRLNSKPMAQKRSHAQVCPNAYIDGAYLITLDKEFVKCISEKEAIYTSNLELPDDFMENILGA